MPYQPLCTGLVMVMERFDGRPLAAIDAGMPADVRAALARSLLDCLLCEVWDVVPAAQRHPHKPVDGLLLYFRAVRAFAGNSLMYSTRPLTCGEVFTFGAGLGEWDLTGGLPTG